MTFKQELVAAVAWESGAIDGTDNLARQNEIIDALSTVIDQLLPKSPVTMSDVQAALIESGYTYGPFMVISSVEKAINSR